MKRFHPIVACLSLNDPDAGVLVWVPNITRLADASRVSSVHAWQPVDIPPGVMERYPRLLEPGVQVAEERIEKLRADRLRESALPPTAMARAVSQENHDRVTIGCRGHDAIYATLLGRTAGAILRACPVPVVAVKKKASTTSFLASLRDH